MVDEEVGALGFVARHDLVLGAQIRAFLRGDEAAERQAVGALVDRGHLRRLRVLAGRDAFASTPAGLEAAGHLPVVSPPVLERGLRRVVGSVWVWIRSKDGRFPGVSVLSTREQVAADLAAERELADRPGPVARFGLRVGGVAADSETGLHYPDVLLQFHDGWCAVHLQLRPCAARELVARLRSYGADDRYGQVVFLVERERIARQVEEAAVSAGVGGVMSVQWMEWS